MHPKDQRSIILVRLISLFLYNLQPLTDKNTLRLAYSLHFTDVSGHLLTAL